MKKVNLKAQNGAISVFVLVSMLFFMVTIVGIYSVTSGRAQTQTEAIEAIQGQYYTEGMENEIYDEKVSNSNTSIPIYTKEQLYLVGSDKRVEIEGVLYTFSKRADYELQNDIVINIDDNVIVVDSGLVKESEDYVVYYYYEGNYYNAVTRLDEYDLEKNGYYFKIR